MTIQKFIKYTPFDITGKLIDSPQELKLTILEHSGNYLLHKTLLRHHNLQRQGTASTKTRSEVRGGGKKPWRQKGTGRARAGSNRSPLWKGGGIIFGPKPKLSFMKLNKKENRLALQTLIYNKKEKILVIKDLEDQLTKNKTKFFLKICGNCKVNIHQQILVIVSEKTIPIRLATQNLKNIKLISATNLNTLSLLKANQILITSSAIKKIKEIYCD